MCILILGKLSKLFDYFEVEIFEFCVSDVWKVIMCIEIRYGVNFRSFWKFWLKIKFSCIFIFFIWYIICYGDYMKENVVIWLVE